MSRWKITFESQELLKRTEDSVRALESIKADGLTPEELAEYGRLLKVLKVLTARFPTLDPELYPQNLYGNFGGLLNSVHSNIHAYQQNRNAGYLQNANN